MIAVAADGQYIYWSESSEAGVSIMKQKADLTSPPEPVVTGLYNNPQAALALAVDSQFIYFGDALSNVIKRASLTTGAVDTWAVQLEQLDKNSYGPYGLAVDSQNIYWTEVASDDIGVIGKASLADPSSPQILVDLRPELGGNVQPTGIAVNSQYVYWTSAIQQYFFAAPAQAEILPRYAIGRASLADPQPDFAFIPLPFNSQPLGMAIDSQHIYWADSWGDSDGIHKVLVANLDASNLPSGNQFDVLAGGLSQPTSVAVDNATVTPPPPGGTTTTTTTTTPPKVSPPQAFADPASVTGPRTATLNGRVGPNGEATTYRFEYGLTTAYGQRSPASDASAGSGTALTAVSAALTGLKPLTTYHYRVVATSAGGTVTSTDQSFTTPRACRDRLGPISRFNLKKTIITRNGLHAVGTSTDRGGCRSNVLDARDGGGISKVRISFARQTGHLNTPLKPGMSWGKPVSVHTWTYNFVAKGGHNWTFNLKMKLQPGLYRVFAMGYDLRGNREPYDAQMRNGILIRVK